MISSFYNRILSGAKGICLSIVAMLYFKVYLTRYKSCFSRMVVLSKGCTTLNSTSFCDSWGTNGKSVSVETMPASDTPVCVLYTLVNTYLSATNCVRIYFEEMSFF